MDENELSHRIIGIAYNVHTTLGPGLLENVYEKSMEYELSRRGFNVESQVGVPVSYNSVKLNLEFRLDLLVENKVIIEVKSVELLSELHYKQLLTYLRLSDKKLGLLINFNSLHLRNSIRRIVNNL